METTSVVNGILKFTHDTGNALPEWLAGAATVTGGNTMLRNPSGLDNHQFNDFRHIQREMNELFGTRPTRSGTSDVLSCFLTTARNPI